MRYIIKRKGFTLVELIVSTGLGCLLIIMLWNAFSVSHLFYRKGEDTLLQGSYSNLIFEKLSQDMEFLCRINQLSYDRDEIQYEIFNIKTLEINDTEDKKFLGKEVTLSLEDITADDGTDFKRLKMVEKQYTWWHFYGVSLEPGEDGYPPEMEDPVTGKEYMETLEPDYLIDQEKGKEFLLQNVSFIPLDELSQPIEATGDYENLKDAKGIRIEIQYLMVGHYGEYVESAQKVDRSITVNFINLVSKNKQEKKG